MSYRASAPALDYLFPENSVMFMPLLFWVFMLYETKINLYPPTKVELSNK